MASDVAEDCVQESFLRLARQETVPSDPAAWLARAVRNAAIDAIRCQQRRMHRENIAAELQPQWLEAPDEAVVDQLSIDLLQQALLQLDDETRDIVVAHLWNEMTFRQIAEAFDTSAATAHRRYEAGLHQLRILMNAESYADQDVNRSDVRNLQ